MYLKKACEFCDLALWLADTTDDLSNKIAYVYFKRAIVYSRLALCFKHDNLQKYKLEKKASKDLQEAVKREQTYLLYAAFDSRLKKLMNSDS